MNSKDSEPAVVSFPSKISFRAALALTTVGSAASGAIVSTGPFVVDPGGFSIDATDGEIDFVLKTGFITATITTYSAATFYAPAGNGNRLGSAFRGAGSVVAFKGGPNAAAGTVLGTFGTYSGVRMPFGRGEEGGPDNWAPILFAEASINGGGAVAGFAQIDFAHTGTTITIHYSDTGAPVLMQGGAISEIPEPSGLSLLALGAAGVLARRRRKEAA